MREFQSLIEQLREADPQLADSIASIEEKWKTGEPRDEALTETVSAVLRRCLEGGLFNIASMTEGFNKFSEEFKQRQREYLHAGKYQAEDYETVRRKVYDNEDYMLRVYYPALLVSYLAVPNYRHILRSLDDKIRAWSNRKELTVLDIASGHGFLLLHLLREIPDARGVAVDLSSAAATFSGALQKITGWGSGRFEFQRKNILDKEAPKNQFDVILCCELLEHLPEPEQVLSQIAKHLKRDGSLFLTAAVRMESVDHLSLFRSVQEVTDICKRVGLEVVTDLSVPFVLQRPVDGSAWKKYLEHPSIPATFVAECRLTSR